MKSFGPVLVALVVIAMIMGLGIWATGGSSQSTSGTTQGTQPPAATQNGGQAAATTPPAQQTGGTTANTTTPAPTAPAKAPADSRAHIDRSNGAKDTMTITAYYADGDKNGEALQPVEMLVPKTTAVAKAIAENVINAPTALKLYSNIPAGTKVNSADLKDGVLTLDLSAEATKITGSAAVQSMQASLVYSLTTLSGAGVQKVLVKVNGKTAIFDQMEWSQPLSRADIEARNWFTVAQLIKYTP